MEISTKRYFFGHTLFLLPPRNPGLYISRLHFFLFEKFRVSVLLFFPFIFELSLSTFERSSQWRYSIKKGSLKFSQKSQENNCCGVSFLIELQASGATTIEKNCQKHVNSLQHQEVLKLTKKNELGGEAYKQMVIEETPIKRCI